MNSDSGKLKSIFSSHIYPDTSNANYTLLSDISDLTPAQFACSSRVCAGFHAQFDNTQEMETIYFQCASTCLIMRLICHNKRLPIPLARILSSRLSTQETVNGCERREIKVFPAGSCLILHVVSVILSIPRSSRCAVAPALYICSGTNEACNVRMVLHKAGNKYTLS